jgi:hypothetical protein
LVNRIIDAVQRGCGSIVRRIDRRSGDLVDRQRRIQVFFASGNRGQAKGAQGRQQYISV